jgi:hypothetical protein
LGYFGSFTQTAPPPPKKSITQRVNIRPNCDQCYDFKNIFAEKFSKKLAFMLKLLLVFAQIVIITLVFEKNANFLPKFVKNRRKF